MKKYVATIARAPLPPVGGSGKDVERIAWLVGEVAADHVRSGTIDQVPGVDAVVAAQVELVQTPGGVPPGVLRSRAWKSMMLTAPTRES